MLVFAPRGAAQLRIFGIFEEHYQAAKKTETHPDEGQWPAYPSGKSHDEAKKFGSVALSQKSGEGHLLGLKTVKWSVFMFLEGQVFC